MKKILDRRIDHRRPQRPRPCPDRARPRRTDRLRPDRLRLVRAWPNPAAAQGLARNPDNHDLGQYFTARRQSWRDDIKVYEAVRKAVGDDYTVMLDST